MIFFTLANNGKDFEDAGALQRKKNAEKPHTKLHFATRANSSVRLFSPNFQRTATMDALSPKNLTQAQKEKLEGLVDKHTVNTLNTLRSVIKENKKKMWNSQKVCIYELICAMVACSYSNYYQKIRCNFFIYYF